MKSIISLVVIFTATNLFAAEIISLRENQESLMKQMNQSAYSLMTENQNLRSMKVTSDGDYKIHKMQQTYKGIPVEGYQTVARVNAHGMVTRLHGYQVKGIEKDVLSTEAKITEQQALNIAKNTHLKVEQVKNSWEFSQEKSEKVIYIDQNQKAHLAYSVSFFADVKEQGQPRKPSIMVDATSGSIISYYNSLNHAEGTGPGGNAKTGKYQYGVDFPAFAVTERSDGKCSFETSNVMTIDLNGSQSRSGGSAFVYDCGENLKKEINGAFSPLNDAHFFGITVFNMYREWFGLNPLNKQLKLRVHYGNNYENAFWDGQAMTFGDGASRFYPLGVLDVTAHEVSHGFTQFNSNLAYRGQSGGMNEAFSDMAGEAAEYYMNGTNDFLVGGTVAKEMVALRYMDDPTKDGKSLGHISEYEGGNNDTPKDPICEIIPQLCQGGGGNIDVHHSSGIYNKVFYNLANTQGWNTRTAFEIFVKANGKYWTANSNFRDGAKAVVDAASDLGYNIEDVKTAFAVVGINP